MFGDVTIFFLCWSTVYIRLNDLTPFHGHSLKRESQFSVSIILVETLLLF